MKKIFIIIPFCFLFVLSACVPTSVSTIDLEEKVVEFQEVLDEFINEQASHLEIQTPNSTASEPEPTTDNHETSTAINNIKTTNQQPLIPSPRIAELENTVNELQKTIQMLKVANHTFQTSNSNNEIIAEESSTENSETLSENQTSTITTHQPLNTSFDNCGDMDEYVNKTWFENLENENNKQLTSTGRELNIIEGCLSEDETMFVFIQNELDGCGKIFNYDIQNNSLSPYVTAPHCANEFGQRNGDQISFIGGTQTNNCINKFTGNYNFIEHNIYDVENIERCFQSYKRYDFPFSLLYSDKYILSEQTNGFTLQSTDDLQIFSFLRPEGENVEINTTETKTIAGIVFQKYTSQAGYGWGYTGEMNGQKYLFTNNADDTIDEFHTILDTIQIISS